MFLQQLMQSLNAFAGGMPVEGPKPALNPRYWHKLGETSEKRRYARKDGMKVYWLQERPVKVFTYHERDSRYDGATLRAVRKKNGVGRPPHKQRRLH